MYYVALAVIAAIFIWRAIVGFRKGMVQEVISLVAMAAAGVCVVLLLGALRSYLSDEILKVIQIIAVLFVVCLVYRLVNVLFISLKLVSKLPIVKSMDKLLGIAVGLAEGMVIVVVLIQLLKNLGLSVLN